MANRFRRRQHTPTYEEALAETEFPEGSLVVEWDKGEDLLSDSEYGTGPITRIRKYKPTGRTGRIEIWSATSQAPANSPLYKIPPPGTKVIRILKKDGSVGLKFIEVMPPRPGYVRRLPSGWKMNGVDPNKSDFYRSKLKDETLQTELARSPDKSFGPYLGAGVVLTILLIFLLISSILPAGTSALILFGLIWTCVIASYLGRSAPLVLGSAIGLLAILTISYALVPQILIKLRMGWLFLPLLLLDFCAWRYFKRSRWPERYLPFLWWL